MKADLFDGATRIPLTGTKSSSTNRRSYTFNEFRTRCPKIDGSMQANLVGNNITTSLLEGVKTCWPEVAAAFPKINFKYSEVKFIVECLCSDCRPTMFDVPVDKFLSQATGLIIRYVGGLFEFSQFHDKLTDDDYIYWYVHNTDVTYEAVDEYIRKQELEEALTMIKTVSPVKDIKTIMDALQSLNLLRAPVDVIKEYMPSILDEVSRIFKGLQNVEPVCTPYYIVNSYGKYYSHCVMQIPIFEDIRLAHLFTESEFDMAAKVAREVNGTIEVTYLSQPISLNQFCADAATSPSTREVVKDYLGLEC